MAGKQNERLKHLLLVGEAEAKDFTSPQSRRPKPRLPRDAAAHGAMLLNAYRHAVSLDAEGQPAQARGGHIVTFECAPGAEMALKSLDVASKGIELLAVRTNDDGDTLTATVFIPNGALTHFEEKFEQYATEMTKKRDGSEGNPKNQALVAPIEVVRSAVIADLWTDTADMPPGDEVRWYEVWLRKGAAEGFQQLVGELEIEVAQGKLEFLDRVVSVVQCSLDRLAESFDVLDCVAEIRNPPVASSFFVDMDAPEQARWAAELRKRLQLPNNSANPPRVCLLDTGVNRAHTLLEPLIAPAHVHAYGSWQPADQDGHGTGMAGLALYGDLAVPLAQNGPVRIEHRLESVRVIGPAPNDPKNYGAITQWSVARAEVAAPHAQRAVCMAVSDPNIAHSGEPTAWSAAVDQLAFGGEGGEAPKRLVILAAGNLHESAANLQPANYPSANHTSSIHDPGQAWNALTVGAYADRDNAPSGWQPLAQRGSLHPNSTTGMGWDKKWPLKPDVVMAGGNVAHNGSGAVNDHVDLQLVTTSHQFAKTGRQFTTFGDTSAACALTARAAASLMAANPNYWPETIRGLLVHTAEWTPQMIGEFNPWQSKQRAWNLLQAYGYGVCNETRAHWSSRNALTLVAQEEIQPYKFDGGSKSNHMHLYALPWPEVALRALTETEVRMRVTLSYFIEPQPNRRGFTSRYQYASHALRFDAKTPTESLNTFQKRINTQAREDVEGKRKQRGDYKKWLLGPDYRKRGSLHSDIWTGSAADLAACGFVAVYPAIGWWRERGAAKKNRDYVDRKVRYSLLVSIEAPEQAIDLYTPVANALGIPLAAN
ncbi:MAG: S8 family peptidase [Planctomycetes bacterium]|nr:S8 family peptidase [Planctomycetota bacterium]